MLRSNLIAQLSIYYPTSFSGGSDALISESSEFALAGNQGSDIETALCNAIYNQSDIVGAAAMFVAPSVSHQIVHDSVNLRNHSSPRLRAATWSSMGRVSEPKLLAFLSSLDETHPLVQIAIGRSISRSIDTPNLISLAKNEKYNLPVRICADEKVLAPEQFQPAWLKRESLISFNEGSSSIPFYSRLCATDELIITVQSDMIRSGCRLISR